MELNEFIKQFPDYQTSFEDQNLGEQKYNYAMYILINKSLGMQKGKIAAQAGHAVQKMTEYCVKNCPEIWYNYNQSNIPKITLQVKTEDQMKDILLETKDIIKSYVIDEGRTQIKPNSLTAVAFIPMDKSNSPKCFKDLKLF